MILQRIDGERFSRVLPLWGGYTVVLLGGGPSFTDEQLSLVRDARAADEVRVIAINDAYLRAPWADVCYAADSKWHTWHGAGVAKPKLGLTAAEVRERWASFRGQKCGIDTAEPYLPDNVHMLRVAPHDIRGLSTDPLVLATGRHDGYAGHGGFQALNLATLSATKRILLVGFDGRPDGRGATHWHGEHAVPTPADVWPHIQRSFSCAENQLVAAGVRVINCSPKTAIDTFTKVDLADALTVAA